MLIDFSQEGFVGALIVLGVVIVGAVAAMVMIILKNKK